MEKTKKKKLSGVVDAFKKSKDVLEVEKEKLGKFRDGLREKVSDYEELLDRVEGAYERLDEAIDILSELV